MIYYIADTHFGHFNVIKFDKRPYKTVQDMDRELIGNWNCRVREDDHVYFLGDVCFRNEKPADWYLRQLWGHKHLIVGNHEDAVLNNPEARKYFESIDQIKEIKDVLNGQQIKIVLCHYPIIEWNGKFHGSWHIYGHIHNNLGDTYDVMSKESHALNAGVCINNYMPVSFKELIDNNKAFQEAVENGSFQ